MSNSLIYLVSQELKLKIEPKWTTKIHHYTLRDNRANIIIYVKH